MCDQLPHIIQIDNVFAKRQKLGRLCRKLHSMPFISNWYWNGTDVPTNPTYLHFFHQDNHVSLALFGSCSLEAQIIISSATSSIDAWAKLQKAYSNKSHTRIMSLKERLASITKGTSGVHDYLRSIRSITDELTLIGHLIDDIDLVIATLNGLGPTF